MKVKKIYLLLAVNFCLLNQQSWAQFKIETEFRPRLEYRHGYSKLSSENSIPAIIMTQRSRLNLSFQQANFNYLLSIQDVRVWGDEQLYSSTGVFGNEASLDIHQAWIEMLIKKHSSIKIGRQIFKYDDERLLSLRNWNQNSITYNALLYRFKQEGLQIHAAVSLNNEEDNTFGNEYPAGKMKTLNFLYLQKELPLHLKLSLITLAHGYTANDSSEVVYVRGTYGGYAEYNYKNSNAALAAYYQNGRNQKGKWVSAYLLSLDARQSIGSFTPGLGIVYISGQDGVSTDQDYQKTDHLFDLLYGARHKFYGLMDYFNNLPKSTKNGGLVDLFATLAFNYGKDNSLKLDIHRFWLQSKVEDPANKGTALDKALGTEFDFTFKQNILQAFKLEGGYSLMLPESSLEIIQGLQKNKSGRSDWLWCMLTFTYTLFPEKKAEN